MSKFCSLAGSPHLHLPLQGEMLSPHRASVRAPVERSQMRPLVNAAKRNLCGPCSSKVCLICSCAIAGRSRSKCQWYDLVPALLWRAGLVSMSIGLWLKHQPIILCFATCHPGLLIQGSKRACLMTDAAQGTGWTARSQPGESTLQAGKRGLWLQADGSDLLSCSDHEEESSHVWGIRSCPSTSRFRNPLGLDMEWGRVTYKHTCHLRAVPSMAVQVDMKGGWELD